LSTPSSYLGTNGDWMAKTFTAVSVQNVSYERLRYLA